MNDIKRLYRELKNEVNNNGNTKRAIFLMATINRYSKQLNEKVPFKDYTFKEG